MKTYEINFTNTSGKSQTFERKTRKGAMALATKLQERDSARRVVVEEIEADKSGTSSSYISDWKRS